MASAMPSTGFEPIPSNTFIEFLDYVKAAEARGLWVAPFGEVAAYFRAQKILEAAPPQVVNGETRNLPGRSRLHSRTA